MTIMAAQIMTDRAEKPFAMNRETWKGDIKINLKKWYKNVHQGQGPAVVFGNCGNEHPGTKKTKNILAQTGHHIS